MSADFRRKNIRWPAANYRGKGFYFVTLCFYSRHRLGTNPGIARWLIAMLRKHAAHHNFHVHAYCVMPDHMHILANAATDSSDLMGFVESFKQETAVAFERRCDRRLWQFKYFDRILRATDLPEQVAWYIWLNPVRKCLCSNPGQYPFAGSFTEVGSRMLKGAAKAPWTPPWKPTTPRF